MQINKICVECSAGYLVPAYRDASSFFCSNACRYSSKIWHAKKGVSLRGLKRSPEVRKRLSEIKLKNHPRYWLGKKRSSETKKKIAEKLFKGVYIERNLNEYKDWRVSVYKRDDYTCQICFVKGGVLNADHIKPYCLFPELRMDVNNGRTLCVPCHKKTETYGRSAKSYANN